MALVYPKHHSATQTGVAEVVARGKNCPGEVFWWGCWWCWGVVFWVGGVVFWVVWCCGVVGLLWCCGVVLVCCCGVVLWCRGVVVWCCGVVVVLVWCGGGGGVAQLEAM